MILPTRKAPRLEQMARRWIRVERSQCACNWRDHARALSAACDRSESLLANGATDFERLTGRIVDAHPDLRAAIQRVGDYRPHDVRIDLFARSSSRHRLGPAQTGAFRSDMR